MEELFNGFAASIALAIEAVAVLVIAFGAAEATVRLVGRLLRRSKVAGQRKDVWLKFAVWLILGLEFELAADVIRAVIRTFLNYFLEQDLEKYDEAGRPANETRIAA